MRKSLKRIIALALVFVSITCISVPANAVYYQDTISFSAGGSGNAANTHPVDISVAYGFYTHLSSVGFVGMPANVMPYGSEVYFRLYTPNGNKATNYNYHNATHFANGTWKHDTFLNNNTYSFDTHFRMRSNSNASQGATVGVNWFYY